MVSWKSSKWINGKKLVRSDSIRDEYAEDDGGEGSDGMVFCCLLT